MSIVASLVQVNIISHLTGFPTPAFVPLGFVLNATIREIDQVISGIFFKSPAMSLAASPTTPYPSPCLLLSGLWAERGTDRRLKLSAHPPQTETVPSVLQNLIKQMPEPEQLKMLSELKDEYDDRSFYLLLWS